MDANLEEKKDIHKQIVSEVRFFFLIYLPMDCILPVWGVGIQVGILNVVKDLVGTHKSPYEGESIFVVPGRAKQGQIFV